MRLVWTLPIAAVAVVAGCQSPGNAPGEALEDGMALGKRVYYGQCIRCHVPEPIANYTADEWRDIVADMAPEAKLTPAQEAAVLRYVLAERAAL